MVKIFLSYSRVDSDTMKKFAELLSYGCDVWYDQSTQGIIGGEDWWKRILSEIEKSEHFVYLLSRDSIESEYCQQELDKAIELGRNIIPVVIRSRTELPEKIKHLQAIQAHGEQLTDGISRIYGAILKNTKVHSSPILSEAHRKADLRLLTKFWDVLPSWYFLTQFGAEIHSGYINSENYGTRIWAYEKSLSLPENKARNTDLKLLMNSFKVKLGDLIAHIGIAFTGDGDGIYKSNYKYVTNTSYLMDEKLLVTKRKEWDDSIKIYENVKEVYLQIIECIRLNYPEFPFD